MTTYAPAPPGMMKMASGRIVPMSRPFGNTKTVVKKMLICLSYYEGDREAAEDLLLLIAELERTRNRETDLLIVRRNDAREISAPVKAKLELKFDKVMLQVCRRSDARGYPMAPNQMFSDIVMLMAHNAPFATDYYAWLNMETDVVPTRPGWIGELVSEWRKAEVNQKFAMGFVHDNPVPHLNGAAVYSPQLLKKVPQLIGSSPQVAYDIWHSKRVLPYAARTELIHFSYRQATITPDDLFAVRKNSTIAPALFHGVKDRSARLAVRARHVTFTEKKPEPTPVFIQPVPEVQSLAVSEKQDPMSFSVTASETTSVPTLASVSAPTPAVETKQETVVSNKRPNVYTYAHKHDGITKPELAAIVAAWTKGWSSRGWNPIVLTLRDAAKHTKFEEFQMAVEKLPCVGDKKRMAHRFYRWLALDVVGGGLLTDFDVLPTEEMKDPPSVLCGPSEYRDTLGKMAALVVPREDSGHWIDDIFKYDAGPKDILSGKPHVTDGAIVEGSQTFDFEHGTALNGLKHFTNLGADRKSVAMERFLEGK